MWCVEFPGCLSERSWGRWGPHCYCASPFTPFQVPEIWTLDCICRNHTGPNPVLEWWKRKTRRARISVHKPCTLYLRTSFTWEKNLLSCLSQCCFRFSDINHLAEPSTEWFGNQTLGCIHYTIPLYVNVLQPKSHQEHSWTHCTEGEIKL